MNDDTRNPLNDPERLRRSSNPSPCPHPSRRPPPPPPPPPKPGESAATLAPAAVSAAARSGQAAYEAFMVARYAQAPKPVLPWEGLRPEAQEAWSTAAAAALSHRMAIAQDALLPAASVCLGAAARLAAMAGLRIDLEEANSRIAAVEQPTFMSPLDVAGHAMGQVLNTLEAVLTMARAEMEEGGP